MPRKSIARSTVEVESLKRRKVLIAPEITKKAARAKTTQIVKGSFKTVQMQFAWEGKKGAGLKAGILGMAQTVQTDAGRYAKLERMDERKLAKLYENNDLVFEVFFSYEGINTTEQGVFINEGAKTDDIDFLIEQYERLYGALRCTPLLMRTSTARISRRTTTGLAHGWSSGPSATARKSSTAGAWMNGRTS